MAEDDAINPKTGRPMWDQQAARRAGVKQGAGYGKNSPNGPIPGVSESDLVRGAAAKMSKGNNPQYWVEKGNVRRGPYADSSKASGYQKQNGGELIFQPRNTPSQVGVTSPMNRQSPRTGKTASRKSLPGVPSYHEGDDTRRGA